MPRTTIAVVMFAGMFLSHIALAQGPAPKPLPHPVVTTEELKQKQLPALGPAAKISAQSVHLSELAVTKCSVSGTVKDAQGAALAGASVRIVEAATGAIHTLTTDAAGKYCGAGLPAGKYSLLIDRAGFRSTRLDALTVASGHAPQADVAMVAGTNLPPVAVPVQVGAIAPPPPAAPMPPVQLAPPPAPLPAVAQPVHADPAYSLGEQEAAWFQQLKNGSIVYDVPQQMTIGEPRTVAVTIYGYKAAVPASEGDQTQPSQLKVAEFMRVEISQADNPNEFTIVHGDNPDEQFVPLNGNQTWTWTVTPNHTGDNQKLKFQAFVIYKDPAQNVQQPLDSQDKTIAVGTRSLSDMTHDAKDNFWLHPMNWVKYVLPGGGGFVILGLLIGWLRKKRGNKDADK